MTARQSAAAYRQSLETRLRQEAEASGRDLNWLRRRHVFLRLLHRLATTEPDRWVLKGGVAVELRRPGLARATRDIDLVMRDAGSVDPRDPDQIHQLLTTALDTDVDGDRFDFVLGAPSRLAEDAYGRPAWRLHVEARLAGKRFVDTRVDVVIRPEELVGLSEAPLPPGLAAPAGAPARVMVVTDLRQQFAEKLHALTRSYAAGGSSRVKDLVDLVVLLDDGVSCDEQLVACVHTVFAVRATHLVPEDLADPPVSWHEPYQRMARDLGVTPDDVDSAHQLIATAWNTARERATRKDS